MSKYVFSFITSLVLCLQPVFPVLAVQSPVDSNFASTSSGSDSAQQAPSDKSTATNDQTNTQTSHSDSEKSSVDALWNQIDSDTSKPADNKTGEVNKASQNVNSGTVNSSDKASDVTNATGNSHDNAGSVTNGTVKSSDKADSTVTSDKAGDVTSDNAKVSTSSENSNKKIADNEKPLQGYIRIVPLGTKIPIIMDAAVDSDTSQEGDEFAARTGEDLVIDGTTVVPAGSVIKGRIAGINAPRNLSRSGTVALKFDTITTPDNRQIPLVATLVARGGVIHARRGMKDIAFTVGTVAVPTAVGLGIGAIAGAVAKSSKIGTGGGALIGAGIGVAIGVIILCAKKGQKVDVRPGDELKIELAEDLHMPM